VRLLVLGGTKFLGRAVVEEALARGHEVTLFNRGETNPELFPEAERLRGDRDGGPDALAGRRWDAIVDPSGYVPRVVRASAELLRESGHYVFISSVSAYATPYVPGFDESAPLAELADPDTEEISGNYGGLKAACERVVEEVFPGRSTIVRAGLIVGPHDPSDRFTYWPTRVARGGEVLAPGEPERQVQFVDVRDLAAWIVRCCEERIAGAFTATAPGLPFGALLEACIAVSSSDATVAWVSEEFLLERDVGQWMELPLWLAEADEAFGHMQEADVGKALAAGLSIRPVEETVRDTLAWAATREERGPGTVAMGGTDEVGLDPEKERRLLAEARAAGGDAFRVERDG
jgi:2'-hydroxyisoflavone reductase